MDIQKILKELRNPELITEHFADALGHTTNMSPKIKPVFEGARVVGRAVTVKTPPGIMSKIFDALTLAGRGEVIVIDAGGDENFAHFGGCISTHAQRKGIEGVVIDGGVRDVIEIRQLKFPIFARTACLAVGGIGIGMGQLNVPITCGGAYVRPGDIIVGDDGGVVVIPVEKAEEALRMAKIHVKFDEKEKRYFAEGKEIWDIFAEFDNDYSKMYEWAEKP